MRLPLLLACAGVLVAQEPPPLSIRIDVNLVNAAFIVRDPSGTLARDLTKDDIEVFEDGVRQDVRFFGRSNDLPLRLALVVDVSGSQEEFVHQHRRDLEAFLSGAITPRDRALLVCFGNHIRVVSDFSSSPGALLDAFDSFGKNAGKLPELEPDDTRKSGTALFDAMYLTAIQKLKPAAGERKALILFSDGEDNSSAHDLMDAIEAAQSADSPIYTVRYTEAKRGRLTARNRYGIREMDRLADETGGVCFDASDEHTQVMAAESRLDGRVPPVFGAASGGPCVSGKDVGDSLRQIGDELRSMYDVGYVTTNPTRDGTFRKLLIRVKRDGVTVRAKPGYYAR